ncbi:MAG: dCTP deaminase [Novosphingobium sp.]
MAVLTREAIVRDLDAGRIVIDPLDRSHIGPNSVDLHIGPELYRYDARILDARKQAGLVLMDKTLDGGWVLRPGTLYLGSTAEWTETNDLVPYLDGRSSLGRLGVGSHVTAGRGDVGFRGRWTVELWCVQPVVIYPGGRYFQITYHTIEGEPSAYQGRYQGDTGPVASRINQ